MIIVVNSSVVASKKRKVPKIDVETIQSTCNVQDAVISKVKTSTNHLNGWKAKQFSIKLTRISTNECISTNKCYSHEKIDEIVIECKTKEQRNEKRVECDKISPEQTDEPTLRRTQRKTKALERFDSDLVSNPKPKQPKAIQIITPIQMSNIIWTELTTKSFDVQIGMVVCAKMATYWPWPAQVINIKGQKARVKFFGDLKEGNVPKFQCVPLIHCHRLIFNYIKTIDEKTRKSWYEDLATVLDASTRSNVRTFPQKKLYLQAVKDIQTYYGSEMNL